jgi:3-oxoacyl-[acyl-carrier-protein] synthase-3
MTNDDWAKIVDTSDEWISTRTGIKERRLAESTTASSDLACAAAVKALAVAKLNPEDVELIVVATTTPDYPVFPSVAALLQDKLGCTKAGGFDISAACSGFGYAFTTACQYVETGMYKNVLLVAVDTLSKFMDWKDRNVCVLFGDAAGAMVIQPVAKGYGHIASVLGLRGAGAEHLIVKAGGSRQPMTPDLVGKPEQYIHMNGKDVFKFAVNIMGEVTEQAIAKAGLKNEDIDLFVPHQANTRIIDAAMKRLNLSPEKVYVNVQRYGNTSSASIPLALDEVFRAGNFKKGSMVATCGFGAGLTWAANVFRWSF